MSHATIRTEATPYNMFNFCRDIFSLRMETERAKTSSLLIDIYLLLELSRLPSCLSVDCLFFSWLFGPKLSSSLPRCWSVSSASTWEDSGPCGGAGWNLLVLDKIFSFLLAAVTDKRQNIIRIVFIDFSVFYSIQYTLCILFNAVWEENWGFFCAYQPRQRWGSTSVREENMFPKRFHVWFTVQVLKQ